MRKVTSTSGIAAVALAALVTGCGSGSSGGDASKSRTTGAPASTAAAPAPAAVKSATVDIRSFKYKPEAIAVKKGGRVKFVNADAAAHTATADDRSFDTQTIEKGDTKMVTFTETGTVAYHCDFHPFMKGTVVVK